MPLKESDAVRRVLYVSCDDLNHKIAIKQLTDEELLYCLIKEDRKTGLKQLRTEARRRGIDPALVVRCGDCETFDDPCQGGLFTVQPRTQFRNSVAGTGPRDRQRLTAQIEICM